MTNIKHLLIFNPHYSSGGTERAGAARHRAERGRCHRLGVRRLLDLRGVRRRAPAGHRLENIDLDNVTQDGNHGNEGPAEGQSPTQYVNAGTDNTNIVPAGPLGDSADDVNVTPFQGTGTVPTCTFPPFGPPPAS